MNEDELFFAHSTKGGKLYDWNCEPLPLYAQANDEWGEFIEMGIDFANAADSAGFPELAEQTYAEIVSSVRQRIIDLYSDVPQGYDTPQSLGLPLIEEHALVLTTLQTLDEIIDWAIENYSTEGLKAAAAKRRQEELEAAGYFTVERLEELGWRAPENSVRQG